MGFFIVVPVVEDRVFQGICPLQEMRQILIFLLKCVGEECCVLRFLARRSRDRSNQLVDQFKTVVLIKLLSAFEVEEHLGLAMAEFFNFFSPQWLHSL